MPSYSVTEGDGTLTVKVVLSGASILGPVQVFFSAADGSWYVGDLPSDDRYTIVALDYTRAYATLVLRGRAPYV